MEPLSILIGAALGSAGLSGLLTGFVQLSRAARKSRLIEHLKKSLDGGEPTGPGTEVLKKALDRERVKLAAISLIDIPLAYFHLLGVFTLIALVMGGFVAVGMGDLLGFTGEPEWTWAVAASVVIYLVGITATVDRHIQRRRNRFIRSVLATGADVEELTRATLPAPAPLPVVLPGAQAV